MMKFSICKLAALLLASQMAYASEGGVAIKADSLRAEPFQDAQKSAALNKGDHAEILQSKGGWLQVKTAQGSGWVRMLSLRRDAARNSSASASSLATLASGRSGKGRIVATTGIRGLNEEELKAAQYNEGELALAESYASSKADAQKFAAQGKLFAQKIDYLPATGVAP
jgi:hypothetical protein